MTEIITSNILESVLAILFSTFLFTYFMIPKIIKVVNHKELMESPNHRSSHTQLTPTFGGVSFFIILVLILLVISNLEGGLLSINIISGLTILLFIGLKDDLVIISYKTKLLGQLLASLAFLYNTNLYKININGFMGFYQLDLIIGIILSILILISIINAFNLIDGIDGLAASTGIIVLSIYAVIYYVSENYFFTLICVSLIGSLLAFLRFNLSSKRKIFMGDTGSLIVGFIVAVMTIKFLNLDISNIEQIGFTPKNSLFIVLSILIFPIFDMIRILMVRISKKQHPLLADKNHTHHVLINLGNSHIKTSILISLFSLIVSITLLYLTTLISNFWLLASIFLVFYLIFLGLFFKLSLSKK